MYVVPTLLTFKFYTILGLCVTGSLDAWESLCVLNLKRNKGLRKELRLSQRTLAQRSDRSVLVWLNLSIFIFLEVSFSISTHALLLVKLQCFIKSSNLNDKLPVQESLSVFFLNLYTNETCNAINKT